MSSDQGALNPDGTLRSASEIQWYESETDELPISTVSSSILVVNIRCFHVPTLGSRLPNEVSSTL